MQQPLITSLSNPLIRQARALRQRKARAQSGLFLAEGIHPVGEALAAGWEIESILYSPDVQASEFARELIASAQSKCRPVSERVMQSLADKDNPQGLLAVVRQKPAGWPNLQALRSGAAILAPQDPGNVGTILRTLDAVGGDALVLLDGGVDPYHPTAVRASMGAIFWKPMVQASFAEFILWARRSGIQLIGSSAHARQSYRDFKPRPPWILLLGSEQKGLAEPQLQACEAAVALPMRGRASSLNLAVAAGILLYGWSI